MKLSLDRTIETRNAIRHAFSHYRPTNTSLHLLSQRSEVDRKRLRKPTEEAHCRLENYNRIRMCCDPDRQLPQQYLNYHGPSVTVALVYDCIVWIEVVGLSSRSLESAHP